MAPIKSGRHERIRAAGIVEGYRLDIERKFALKPNCTNAKDVRKIIDLLRKIEGEIKQLGQPGENKPIPAIVYPGDFSVEEMEQAQQIIAEQEHNPFEV